MNMAKYKIVITERYGPDIELEKAELLDAGLDAEVVLLDSRSSAEIAERVGDADALMVVVAPITRQVIERLQHCRVISRFGTGVDMIDLAAARERGIPVCNVPEAILPEMSSHTLAMMLIFNRKLLAQDKHVRRGGWFPPRIDPPQRLLGQVLGLVGFGHVGQAVMQSARCLGLRVIAFDPYVAQPRALELGMDLVGLEELLRASDYVSIHCPLTPQTYHMIGAAQLRIMKPTAVLINISRGPIIDQAALYQALVNGTIAGAGLDVLEQEPPQQAEALLALDNVIFTPHSGFWSEQSVEEIRRGTARNVAMVLQGQVPRNVVSV
jgi:D-3-phosphoglycerate dehydrogenase / 2-oxoglutarate reductase